MEQLKLSIAQLSNYTNYILLALCALLILCIALLFAVLRKQKKMNKALSERDEITVLGEQMLSSFKAQDERLNALFYTQRQLNDSLATQSAQTRDLFGTQQQLFLQSSADSQRMNDQRFDALGARLDTISQGQETRLHRIAATLDERLAANDQRSERLRASLTTGLDNLQKDNAEKLEKMRQTVDEKLHETLNRRLGESFSLVNERLEQVYKGLGEMQTLANGVGDLKRVLTNVKSRGIWGEMQLGNLLEQMLVPSQYDENVKVIPSSADRVEFAIRLPGNGDGNQPVYLPIDSKFPVEAYERLLSANEGGDAAQISAASADLARSIRTEATRISKKYIMPPYTTDFAVMFLSTEGLYAEALRCRGLMEELQQKHRILVAGPSTLTSLLSSLQVGFRTLAIEQRSAEVWQLLGAVKTEFSAFSELLEKTQQRLRQASDSIEKASIKTRKITRRLRDVEALESSASTAMLGLGDEDSLEE